MLLLNDSVPRSYSRAVARPGEEGTKWKKAADEEVQAMKKNAVWSRVDNLPTGTEVIPAMWIFSVKNDGRHKARLVAIGKLASVKPGECNSAPVAALSSLRSVVAMAVHRGMSMHVMDVCTAFLHDRLPAGD